MGAVGESTAARTSLPPLLPVVVEWDATSPELLVVVAAGEQPARTATAATEANPSLSFRIFMFSPSVVLLSEVAVQDPVPAIRGQLGMQGCEPRGVLGNSLWAVAVVPEGPVR